MSRLGPQAPGGPGGSGGVLGSDDLTLRPSLRSFAAGLPLPESVGGAQPPAVLIDAVAKGQLSAQEMRFRGCVEWAAAEVLSALALAEVAQRRGLQRAADAQRRAERADMWQREAASSARNAALTADQLRWVQQELEEAGAALAERERGGRGLEAGLRLQVREAESGADRWKDAAAAAQLEADAVRGELAALQRENQRLQSQALLVSDLEAAVQGHKRAAAAARREGDALHREVEERRQDAERAAAEAAAARAAADEAQRSGQQASDQLRADVVMLTQRLADVEGERETKVHEDLAALLSMQSTAMERDAVLLRMREDLTQAHTQSQQWERERDAAFEKLVAERRRSEQLEREVRSLRVRVPPPRSSSPPRARTAQAVQTDVLPVPATADAATDPPPAPPRVAADEAADADEVGDTADTDGLRARIADSTEKLAALQQQVQRRTAVLRRLRATLTGRIEAEMRSLAAERDAHTALQRQLGTELSVCAIEPMAAPPSKSSAAHAARTAASTASVSSPTSGSPPRSAVLAQLPVAPPFSGADDVRPYLSSSIGRPTAASLRTPSATPGVATAAELPSCLQTAESDSLPTDYGSRLLASASAAAAAVCTPSTATTAVATEKVFPPQAGAPVAENPCPASPPVRRPPSVSPSVQRPPPVSPSALRPAPSDSPSALRPAPSDSPSALRPAPSASPSALPLAPSVSPPLPRESPVHPLPPGGLAPGTTRLGRSTLVPTQPRPSGEPPRTPHGQEPPPVYSLPPVATPSSALQQLSAQSRNSSPPSVLRGTTFAASPGPQSILKRLLDGAFADDMPSPVIRTGPIDASPRVPVP